MLIFVKYNYLITDPFNAKKLSFLIDCEIHMPLKLNSLVLKFAENL